MRGLAKRCALLMALIGLVLVSAVGIAPIAGADPDPAGPSGSSSAASDLPTDSPTDSPSVTASVTPSPSDPPSPSTSPSDTPSPSVRALVAAVATPSPTVALNKTAVVAGGSLTATLGGFAAGAQIVITLDSATISGVFADGSGAASVSLVIPAVTTGGSHELDFVDQGSSASTSATVSVFAIPPLAAPTLSEAIGLPGDTVMVTGAGSRPSRRRWHMST